MSTEPEQPPVVDPDRIQETLCLGQFNVSVMGPITMLTFTHPRPKAAAMFGGTIEYEALVRARIVMPTEGLASLRDVLNRVLAEPDKPASAAGGRKH